MSKLFNEGVAVFVSSLEEQKELFKLAENNGVHILYESLKNDGVVHPCWGIHADSMALIGTNVLRTIKKEKIFHSVEDFRKFLEENN